MQSLCYDQCNVLTLWTHPSCMSTSEQDLILSIYFTVDHEAKTMIGGGLDGQGPDDILIIDFSGAFHGHHLSCMYIIMELNMHL